MAGTDLRPCPPEALQESVALALDWPLKEIQWSRMRNSSVNYVYRARHDKTSVVVKNSDNTVILTQWAIPPDHLRSMNYVYRARHDKTSVVVKNSDNTVILTQWAIPPDHLRNEFTFLKLMKTSPLLAPHIPDPIAFIEETNTLVMSDIGKTRFLLHHGFPWFQSRREIFGQVGRLLAAIHSFNYPKAFISRIDVHDMPRLVCRFKLEPQLHEDWDYLADFAPGAGREFVLLDFSPRNILHSLWTFHLIDFDLITVGYQLFDVAHFISYILLFSVKRADRKLAAALQSFLVEYCRARGKGRRPDDLLCDEKFTRYFTGMFYNKLLKSGFEQQERVIRDFLLDFNCRQFPSWDEFTGELFALRRKLK